MLSLQNSSSTSNTSNSTTAPHPLNIIGPTWNFMTAFYVLTIICTLTTNGTVLVTFLSRKILRTSFNIYLMNLLATNILMVILENIPDLFNQLYSGWWLGEEFCSVLVVGLYFSEAGVQNCHMLIAINRMWAVFSPYSYRTHHKKPVALLLCSLSWLGVCAMTLPGIVLDAKYYREDLLIHGCRLNIPAQWLWSVVIQFLVYDMGLFFMWASYPIIWYKRQQAVKISPAKVTNQFDTDPEGQEISPSSGGQVPPARKASSKAFTVLTVLTISVTFCWTPVHTIYTVMVWVPYERIGSLLVNIAVVLVSLQAFLDPILFVYALPVLRVNMRQLYGV